MPDFESILEKIDQAVGPPESETPEQRQKRREEVEKRAKARKLRKTTNGR